MKKLNNGCTFSDLHLSTDVDGGRDLVDLDATLADYEVPVNAILYLKVRLSLFGSFELSRLLDF
jgi:hypothetical protein